MKTAEIRMYNALKPSLGEEDAQVFVEAHNEGIAAKIEIMKSDLATKEDIGALEDQFAALDNKVTNKIAGLEIKLTEGLAINRGEILTENSKSREDFTIANSKLREDFATVSSRLHQEFVNSNANLRAELHRIIYIVGFIQFIGVVSAIVAIIRASK